MARPARKAANRPPQTSQTAKATAKAQAAKAPAAAAKSTPSVLPGSPQDTRPPRPTKAEVEAERFPNLDRNPALRRALAIHRAMLGGKTREAAERLAEEKYGPRSPRTAAKAPKKSRGARGKRPEPEKRMRVKPTPSRSGKGAR